MDALVPLVGGQFFERYPLVKTLTRIRIVTLVSRRSCVVFELLGRSGFGLGEWHSATGTGDFSNE